MVQATQSNAGKSLFIAVLLRICAKRGIKAAPFKPQNMSTNAAVTKDQHEISRAQALQAKAAGIEPHYTMNPILLKPQAHQTTHVIINGRYHHQTDAHSWLTTRQRFMPDIIKAYQTLEDHYDIIVIEGAGSPAEVNLPAPDIANMGFALTIHSPVILLADIESGGSLASIIGTYQLLKPSARRRLKGYIINKFRGSHALLAPAFPIIAKKTGLAWLGTLPWTEHAERLPLEDSLAFQHATRRRQAITKNQPRRLRIIVPSTPHLANSDDIDPLRLHADVDVHIAQPHQPLPNGDIILLPGSKAVLSDIDFIEKHGWHIDILRHYRQNKPIIGLCGGYQMLGKTITDPEGREGIKGQRNGLGLLDMHTTLAGQKTLSHNASIHAQTNTAVTGYEMHIGTTQGPDTKHPMLKPNTIMPEKHGDGGASQHHGQVQGCYLHGIFCNDAFRHAYLAQWGGGGAATLNNNTSHYENMLENCLDELATFMEHHIDVDHLLALSRQD